ncbi:DEAD/DEAH box helicase family protein, partial [Mediterraneibacter sp. 210702-DFI.5.30]|uniref:DEAD/DEAH box helicase family protein n=1 Tax=Mediterraneibacter sp. 210702-DFI.5.30 TaxID=2883232 RepID=UPI001D085581
SASQTSQSDLITPNAMQKAACKRIEALRQAGEKRALVISATGTGKTYLAAFAVQSAQRSRVVVVAHREQLLLKARASFQKIIGGQDQ